MMRHRSLLPIVALALLLPVPPASAEVSSALVLVPWRPQTTLETRFSVLAGYDGDTSTANADIDLTRYFNVGRARVSQEPGAVSVGWKFSLLDIDTTDPVLPERLSSQAVAVEFALGEWEDWQIVGTAGFGYAGNTPYNDGDAWFGLASIAGTKRLDNGAMLSVLLDYNGNRSIFPDIPLPGFAYSDRYNDQLRYTIGLPINRVVWTPDDKWTLQATWAIPFAFTADIDYALTEDVQLFARYFSERGGFKIQGGDENRRLFFEQDRLEVGARWQALDYAQVIGAMGYAFDQSFESGFDVRDTTTVRDISDEPYVRFAVRLEF